MKKAFIVIGLLLVASVGHSEVLSRPVNHSHKIFGIDSLEEAARKALFKHLLMIRYPKSAREDHVSGKVVVMFNVNPDNTITNFQIQRGLTDDINAEVVKTFSGLALPSGLPKDVNFVASIVFSLQDPDNPLAVPRSKVDYNRQVTTGYVPNNFKILALNEMVTYAYIRSVNRETAAASKAQLDTFYRRLAYAVAYPKIAVNTNIEGYTSAQFNVSSDHKIINVRIIQGLSEEINNEMVRVLSNREVPPIFQPEVNYSAPFHWYISHTDGSKPKPINYVPGKIPPYHDNGFPAVRLQSTTVAKIIASEDDN